MYIYELKYDKNNIKLLKKDTKIKFLFAILLFLSTLLTWFVSILILNSKGIMTTEEWILAIGITFISVFLILFLVLSILRNTKLVNHIKSENEVKFTEFRFFKINHKSDFSILYFWLMVIFVALLLIITIATFVIKLLDGQVLSQFLMLFLFLTICGFNSLFHIKIKQKIDSECGVEPLNKLK